VKSQISNPICLKIPNLWSQISDQVPNLSWKWKCKLIIKRKSTKRYLTHYILDIITHDILSTVVYTLLITQFVQYRFSIKRHPKQKYFDGFVHLVGRR